MVKNKSLLLWQHRRWANVLIYFNEPWNYSNHSVVILTAWLDFAMICWLLLLQVVQQEYTSIGATTGPDLPVEFESDSISLQLPSKREILNGGWRLFPLFYPSVRECQAVSVFLLFKCLNLNLNLQITKKQVDSFTPGKKIPSCQLVAKWIGQGKPSELSHKVTLMGAKEPSNFFHIVLNNDSNIPGTHFIVLHVISRKQAHPWQ